MQPNEPVSPNAVPETAATYERTKQNNDVRPGEQKNSAVVTPADARGPLPPGGAIAGDMNTEVPDGWDQAPNDIQDVQSRRHPRPDGVGGSDPNNTHRSEIRQSELGG